MNEVEVKLKALEVRVTALEAGSATPIKEEYEITCSVCGKKSTVPFKPHPNSSGLKCRECFASGASK